jgi:hypothetical protein
VSLRNALIVAGAPPEMADKAVEEVAALHASRRRSLVLPALLLAVLWALFAACLALELAVLKVLQ